MTGAPLWKYDEVVGAISATRAMGDWREAVGVSIRSSDVRTGDLFVALKGEKNDGHDYLPEVAAKGASAAIVSRNSLGSEVGIPLLFVDDTLVALEKLGRTARARSRADIVAVTGSAGKTTTKEMLRTALSGVGETYATEGNLNNEYGVPLSLARLSAGVRYGIFELGMSHAGEIGSLSRLVRPQVAAITNVSAAHLEFFSSVDAIADAKGEIFEGLASDGAAVVSRDGPYFDRLIGMARGNGVARTVSFGRHVEADAVLLDWEPCLEGMEVRATLFGAPLSYILGAVGEHMAVNSLASLLVVAELGASVQDCAASLRQFRALGGRGQTFQVSRGDGSFTVIDDSYNANPASVRAAIRLLGAMQIPPGGRRTIVLGDMLELGPASASLHAGLLEDLLISKIDVAHCCGAMSKALFDRLPDSMRGAYSINSKELAEKVSVAVREGDVVVVKGSRGSKMEIVVNELRR